MFQFLLCKLNKVWEAILFLAKKLISYGSTKSLINTVVLDLAGIIFFNFLPGSRYSAVFWILG